MKLIFIHGRAQQDYDERYLKFLWEGALNEGLQKANLKMPDQVKIEFPYYGKLLDKLVKEFKSKPKQDEEVTRGFAQGNNLTADYKFLQSYLKEVINNSALSSKEKSDLKEELETSRGILNSAIIQELLAILDKIPGTGPLALQLATLDVFRYLNVSHIHQEVNAVVKKCFDEEPCVVVGHSLGSVVSYLVLREHPHKNVQKLITVGSPLGVKAVKNYLPVPLDMPKCIINGWYNAFDPRDVVALHALDQKHFNIKPAIVNKTTVDNITEGRHSIDGYLNDPDVAKTIHEALIAGL